MTATVDARAALQLKGAIYEGDILIRFKDANGNFGARIGPISPVKLAINPGETTVKTRTLKLRKMWGQRADPVTTEAAEPKVAFETDDANAELIRLALRGTVEAVNEAAAADVTDEAVPVPRKGDWLQLPHRNIAVAGFSGKHAAGAVLVAGTDYVLQDIWLQYGLVWIPATSTIAPNEACKWSYDAGAVTGTNLIGNTEAQVTLNVEMFGTNRVDQSSIHLVIHEIAVTSATETDFAGSDYFKPQFSGVMSTPNGKAGPYEIETLTFAAP
ncbi:MAG: hypothetical protein IPP10_14580 [Candidatus Competibacteraceae bacterium]|jgi:hypothetical protein|nr:hypothetical protein [Candidatus Competibacteraceae bacterium]MBK8963389.1 hypothetical protein [Candidatus Competibacteraceae bacterium]MBK9952694.1 hypothetical protein [Candidatus Competibacteraceae bacterium]